ncbi:MAG: 2-oxo acid dehydrogenase subunit E2 [Spirochaetota bacterium]
MTKEIKLPEISESTEAGTVVSVLVSKGDSIEKDDPIVELETDKASVEVPASDGGTVTEILVSEGDEVSVGQTILKVDTEGGGEEAAEEEEAPEETEADAEKEAPKKEAAEEEAPDKEADEQASKEEAPEKEPSEEEAPEQQPDAASVPAAPSTRRLARELGVDITEVSGSGPGGRISPDDVKTHVREGGAAAAAGRKGRGTASKGRAPAAKPLPDFSQWGKTRRQSQNRIRSLTAENTQYSWQTVPHVTQFDEADISAIEEFRERYSDIAEKQDAKLTVTAVLVKIVAEALKRFPRFNASLDEEADEVILKEFVNVGVAVDSDRGLLVPVLRDADKRSLIDIARSLGEVAKAARNKKIKPEELQGGTFTISNLGGIGGTAFTPVIFHPQVAILGIARATTLPVWEGGSFVPQLRLPLTLSYDHRVIDGADGARFLRWICEALEHPLFLHLEDEALEGGEDE